MSQRNKKLVFDLLDEIAEAEQAHQNTQFLAPCTPGAKLRTRIDGLLKTFTPSPADFQGWGIFEPIDEQQAQLVEEAELWLVEQYLELFAGVRLWLIRPLQQNSWLAVPANRADAKQKLGRFEPVIVHMVEDADPFERCTARFDGQSFWFQQLDRHHDPELAEGLRRAALERIPSEDLRLPGLTPELRAGYSILVPPADEDQQEATDDRGGPGGLPSANHDVHPGDPGRGGPQGLPPSHANTSTPQPAQTQPFPTYFYQSGTDPIDRYDYEDDYYDYDYIPPAEQTYATTHQRNLTRRERRRLNRQARRQRRQGNNGALRAEDRLTDALDLAGARLLDYSDRGEHWLVQWEIDGSRHHSMIAKGDLTVQSAGICLSGGDRAFDLQSLVGVVQGRGY